MELKHAADRLVGLLFPPRCALCGEVTAVGAPLCPICAEENPLIHEEKRILLPDNGKTVVCRVPYAYDGKIREGIIRFKFYGRTAGAEFFGRQIAAEFRPDGFDFVTAVPVSAARRKARGYNQAELLARAAAVRLKLPYRETLVKAVDNREQHRLSERERRKNVRGVYSVVFGQEISGKSILLVDDIVTTGATLGACAGVLFGHGAAAVSCGAIALVMLA